MSGEPDTTARLDSADGSGRSFTYHDARGALVAERLDEVVPALRRVEEAAAAGLHAVGFVAYEAAPAFDPALRVPPRHPHLPLLHFSLFQHRRECDPTAAPAPPGDEPAEPGPWRASAEYPEYRRGASAIREWIADGETYQVNYTFRLRADFAGSDLALYQRLRGAQRAGYCALLRTPRFSILSLSPELFFRWSGGELELRPMKGTRPRGRWTAEDRAREAELLGSAKERAENLMIVDLLRNDAGRLAEYGSVHVPELFRVERYPTVLQLTSTIRARTRPDVTLPDLFRALFPSGSVTGAPKVSTMRRIAELEREPRGVYCGAVGFVSPGEAVFNVPIRTLLLDRARGVVELGVGSGVTYDSRPEAEYRECLQKAAFVRAGSGEFELLETLRYDPKDGFAWLDEHLARMTDSAEYLGFAFAAGAARRALAAAVAGVGAGAWRVRLLAGRRGGVRAEVAPLDELPSPLRARLDPEPVDSGDPMLFHKTTRRELYQRRRARHPDRHEVLLLNQRGELTEFTTGNLVVRSGGVHWTPPLESGLLPGVLRGVLLGRGELRERVIRPEELPRAEGVFLVNSVRGWASVKVDGLPT